MVQPFKPAKRTNNRKKQNTRTKVLSELTLSIQTLDHEGQGVAREHKPVTFVEGALPGEQCRVALSEQKASYNKGRVIKVLTPHPQRQSPQCVHFGECGGCQTQYFPYDLMLEQKQVAVTNLFKKFLNNAGDLSIPWQPAISAGGTQYRRKARLAVDFRDNEQRKVGYRGRGSNHVIAITECPVLLPQLEQLIAPLQRLATALSAKTAIGHIDILQGDALQDGTVNYTTPMVVIRTTRTLSQQNRALLSEFAQSNDCHMLLQPKSGESEVLAGSSQYIHYALPEAINIRACSNDFMQVNATVNRAMVTTAMDWLDLQPKDKILDLFCGLGNFSLPLAKHVSSVVGLEGIPEMVQRASQNAQKNSIDNVEFVCRDLDERDALSRWRKSGVTKVVLDPSRAGAKHVMGQIMELNPEKVLYVSCNPATFGRDIAQLVAGTKKCRYRLEKVALLDMFPYTAHTELMSLFVRQS